MNADPRKTPLIVIDTQNGFLNSESESALPAINRLVRYWHEKEGYVFFSRFINEEDSFWRKLIGWSKLSSSPEIDLHESLDTSNGYVFNKTTYSSFTPEVERLFHKNQWSDVVLCGIATDGCVLKTSVDVFEKGIVPFVATDACASHAGERIHKNALELIGRFIGRGQLVETKDIVDGAA